MEEKQHTPIMIGLKALTEEREWEVAVVPLVAGQRSVREKKWLEALGIFGIGKEDGQRIIARLGRTLLDEHEKLFGSYWWHTFGPSARVEGPRESREAPTVEDKSSAIYLL